MVQDHFLRKNNNKSYFLNITRTWCLLLQVGQLNKQSSESVLWPVTTDYKIISHNQMEKDKNQFSLFSKDLAENLLIERTTMLE